MGMEFMDLASEYWYRKDALISTRGGIASLPNPRKLRQQVHHINRRKSKL
jgi:hypothetical protein